MNTTYLLRTLAFAGIVAVAAARIASADEVVVHHDAWTTDHNGYWDDHSTHHAFVMHEHHHGYWRDRDGVRVFINAD